MEQDAILSFSSPIREAKRVQAMPSPVLELAYVFYFLQSRDASQHADELPWVKLLFDEHHDLVISLREFWNQEERQSASADLLWMACDTRFIYDTDVRNFLESLPSLPAQLLQRMAEEFDKKRKESEQKADRWQATQRRLESLTEPRLGAAYRDLLKRLWRVLEPLWQKEGRSLAERAAERYMERFEDSDDVLAGLPKYHFTRAEDSAKHIRLSQEQGKVLVIPLYFAAEGGINFDMPEKHFIGYGIQGEAAHKSFEVRVNKAAMQMKSFADPTRFMLLALIAKYPHGGMTVGELAAQLSVSQPTVSGHLKVLREVGIVSPEKQGNRTFYQINHEAVEQALHEVRKLILRT